MADRYLRASGNWNGPVWAATSNGAAGSAATPTVDDSVLIEANFAVTLVDDIHINRLFIKEGTFNAVSYDVTTEMSCYTGDAGTRTINMGSGTWTINGGNTGTIFAIDNFGSGTTALNAGTSLLVLNETSGAFVTGGKTFNDVRINMSGDFGSELNITGSPTFRLLDIRSANSAAHTVNFDGTSVIVDKFIAIGSSTSNRLKLSGATEYDTYLKPASQTSTSYGQFLNMDYLHADYWYPGPTPYVGSNSIGQAGWVYQDPPKISTLVDPLTTAPGSNPNWTVSGTVTQVTSGHDGGGYINSSSSIMTSTDTYDLIDSEIVVEYPEHVVDVASVGALVGAILSDDKNPETYTIASQNTYSAFSMDDAADNWTGVQVGNGKIASSYSPSYPDTRQKVYLKLAISSSGLATMSDSTTGTNWRSIGASKQLSEPDISMLRSTRIYMNGMSRGGIAIGSINPSTTPPSTGAFLPFFLP